MLRLALSLSVIAGVCLAGCDSSATPSKGEEREHDPVGVAPRSTLSEIAATQSAAPLKRLTRAQLTMIIKDVLAVDVSDLSLPGDGRAGPFTSNATVGLSRLTIDQYMALAEEVAARTDLALIVPCALDAADEDACVRSFVGTLGQRLYRRPVPPESAERLLAIYEQARADQLFATGIRATLAAMLQSPYFLYQVEMGKKSPEGSLWPLDGFELASRLALALWGTAPDEALLAAAAIGELDDAAGVRSHAHRLLADPRAKAQIGMLHTEWLLTSLSSGGKTRLASLDKDRERYPLWNEGDLAVAMETELVDFADFVVRQSQGTLSTLLTASFGFPQGPLFDVYGLEAPASRERALPVSFDPNERRGILTLASVQAALSHPKFPSVVARGLMLFDNLMCQEVLEPPAGTSFTIPQATEGLTRLEALKEHQESGCASCHRAFDPLGLAFEHYGASGEFRTFDLDDEMPVRDAITVATGTDLDGTYPNGLSLIDALPHSPTVQSCTTLQWFRFVLGRWEKESDQDSLREIAEAFASSGFRLDQLLLAIVSSDAFRARLPPDLSP